MSFIPIVAEAELEPAPEKGQLGAAESRLVDTKVFRKCHVSTTLSDLLPCHFKGRDGENQDCCVAFLQFNFGPQKQGSDQRITYMTIQIDVDIEESSVVSDNLEIKGIYPTSASGPVEEKIVSNFGEVSINPNVNGIAVGSVTARRETQSKQKKATSLISAPAGRLGARWQLEENEILKSGVPLIVNCAFVFHGGGLPFEIDILFSGKCPLMGALRAKGKATMRIGRDLLWMRSAKVDERLNGWDDIDSEAFKEFLKTKTRNSWAEKVEWMGHVNKVLTHSAVSSFQQVYKNLFEMHR